MMTDEAKPRRDGQENFTSHIHVGHPKISKNMELAKLNTQTTQDNPVPVLVPKNKENQPQVTGGQ